MEREKFGQFQALGLWEHLIEYTSFILRAIEEGPQVDYEYTDFSKSFD
jgi:hypothetical protein